MLISHAGAVGLALEGGVIAVPVIAYLVLRRRYKAVDSAQPRTDPAGQHQVDRARPPSNGKKARKQ